MALYGCNKLLYLFNKWYLEDKEILEKQLSKNFNIVDGTIIESNIGTLQINKGKYDSIRYVPYIKYCYYYDDNKYICDKYSFPFEYEYKSSIMVKQIIDEHKKKFYVYINKNNPSESYLKIYDDEINKEIYKLFDKKISFSIIPIAIIISCIIELINVMYYLISF